MQSWDFEKNGPVRLDGQWEFYWDRLLEPEDFRRVEIPKQTGYMNLPDVWNSYIINGKELSGFGHATFRLVVKLNDPPPLLACSIKQQETAYRLFINDKVVLSTGKVGTNRESMVPQYLSRTGIFRPEGTTLQFIIQVSNYYHKKGGVRNTIEIGTETQMRESREAIRDLDLFLFGSLLIIAFYHLGLFWLRRSDISPLLFGAFCFFFAMRIIFDGTYWNDYFPGSDWGVVYKMSYLCSYVALPLFATFIYTLYPFEFSKTILRFIHVIGALFTALVIVTPARIYTHSAISYQLIILISLLYIFYVLLLAVIRRREGSLIFIIGFVFLFISIVIFLLDDNGIIDTHDFMPLGIFIFIFAQSLLLSMRFSSAFSTVEIQSEELKDIRNYLNNIINSMPSQLIGLDNEGRVTHWNNETEKATGLSETQAMGRFLEEIFPHLDQRIINTSKNFRLREPVVIEKLTSMKNNEVRHYNAVIYPLVTNGIEGTVLRIDDTTELEKKEAQLRQAQKMETVGTLAGGLAHDFNNVLSGIFGTISIIKHKLKKYNSIERPKFDEYLDVIENSSIRARDMVQQLLTLSRKQELVLAPVNCNTIVRNIIKICDNSIDKSIRLDPHYSAKDPIVYADAAQVEQVLLNLCINASHAMTLMRSEDEKWGGALTIAIDMIFADRYFCNTHPEAENINYWMISVKDTGVGMDSNTLTKIFTPFFTTKKKGSGTGLGLSMVYNIVKQHRGFIDIYSEVGIGSSFNVYLPAHEETISETTEKDLENTEIPGGTGLVLVVDDEEIMRITARDILEECGYTPVITNGGQQALSFYEKHHEEIVAVLLDMVMPDLSGKEVFLKMRQINPDVRVLLSSGFRLDERVEDVMSMGIKGFIQKPYSLNSLARSIYKVVNE